MSTRFSVGQMNQLADALEVSGWSPEDVTKLRSYHDLSMIRNVVNGTAKIVDIEKVAPKILKLLGTLSLPAIHGKFVARHRFVIDTKENAKVKFSYFGPNFVNWFMDKSEDSIGATKLCGYKLLEDSVDAPIVAELGGEGKVETTLQELYSALKKQRKGEKGDLLADGWWNIFYVRDAKGTLRAVYVRWDGVGWRVFAHEVSNPVTWGAGSHVFTRNS